MISTGGRRGSSAGQTAERVDDLTFQLFLDGAPETQHVSAVVGDLEGSESIARIGQFSMHRNLPACELSVQ